MNESRLALMSGSSVLADISPCCQMDETGGLWLQSFINNAIQHN
jgi:hypothetical protein